MTVTLVIIILTALLSIQGFANPGMRYKGSLVPYRIFNDGEYYRVLSSGFFHADWLHLIVNIYVLYIFGEHLEFAFGLLFPKGGTLLFIGMYLSAIVAANISTVIRYREVPHYTGLGASGAVSAVLFAFILLYPTQSLMLLFIPIPIPAIVMGGLYLIYSAYMARKASDNINHEAHFYGAVYGMLFLIVFKPELALYFFQSIMEFLP